MTGKYDRLIELSESTATELKSLAFITGLEIYNFFQGFDFTGMNLSGQDLTGMNFDGADFSQCDLNKIRFDMGAFNNAKLPKKFSLFKDVYDITFSDLASDYAQKIHAFFAFRPQTFSQIRLGARLPFTIMAREVGLSTRTIRNADEGIPVAYSTATRLAKFFTERDIIFRNDQYKFLAQISTKFVTNFIDPLHFENQSELFKKTIKSSDNVDYLPMPRVSLRQPIAVALELIPSGGFQVIKRDMFNFYLDHIRRNWSHLKETDGLLSPNALRSNIGADRI
jgi:hypothetical protein